MYRRKIEITEACNENNEKLCKSILKEFIRRLAESILMYLELLNLE